MSGITLPNVPPALLYRACELFGTLERELKHLDVFAPTGSTAIDVGANVGLWSYGLARRFKRIEAFEPIPRLYKNLERVALPGVRLHNVALSSQKGQAELKIPSQGNSVIGIGGP